MTNLINPSLAQACRLHSATALALASLLAACTVLPPKPVEVPNAPAQWSLGTGTAAPVADSADWWLALPDPALPELVRSAEAHSPTLVVASARLAEARALLSGAQALRMPLLQAQGSAGRAKAQGGTDQTLIQSTASLGLNLGWELDLFGRLAHNAKAAEYRLDAQEADASATRLALHAQIASTSLSRHACGQLRLAQTTDVVSREASLTMTTRRYEVGQVSRADVSRIESGLAESRGALTTTQAQCDQLSLALATLTMLPWKTVEGLYAADGDPLPVPPPAAVGLPATVLAVHPTVRAAMQSTEAAYQDIGVAMAARLPRFSLSMLLGPQWIGLAGGTTRLDLWSLGGTGSMALFDGGAGRANVDAARARYEQTLALLQSALQVTVQEVETAFSNLRAAEQRERHARAGLAAARQLFDANNASWRSGRTSLFELESSRQSVELARRTLITASRDRGLAWVDLARSTGGTLVAASSNSTGD
ncbi:MAG: efflux transporter outer membrane subunit [Burkholderiaceae bacterium]|nr:efflux transporter outer membrane subunit [Burkholderiaceae bacterium]